MMFWIKAVVTLALVTALLVGIEWREIAGRLATIEWGALTVAAVVMAWCAANRAPALDASLDRCADDRSADAPRARAACGARDMDHMSATQHAAPIWARAWTALNG